MNWLPLSIVLSIVFSPVCLARQYAPIPPEELEAQATLICNGTVLSVKDTGIKRNFTYSEIGPSSLTERVILAKIKVLHVFKGKAPAIITFRYRIAGYANQVPEGDEHINLEKGVRYRYFLKPDPTQGGCVGVLEGKLDDGFAVEKLWAHEPNGSPYLTKEVAMMIAYDYLKSTKADSKYGWIDSRVMYFPQAGGAMWRVFVNRSEVSDDFPVGIFVRNDRTVDTEASKLPK